MTRNEQGETSVRTERHGAVLVLMLEGPSTKNAIGPAVYRSVQAEIIAAGVDSSIRAVLLAGSGGYFSSGGNVAALKESAKETLAQASTRTDQLNAMILAIVNCPKPVIAAVEGGAAGAGLSLVLACDMIVAARSARFALAQVRVGLCPDGGATHFLGTALPKQLVMEMCLLGQPVSAERLSRAGMINVLTRDGQAVEAALELADRLAGGPGQAIGTIKSLIRSAARAELATQLDREARAINASRFSAEAAEGLSAFLEKRPARFARLPVGTERGEAG